ncbi:MAG: hypothetical protein ACPIOQ_09555 [Promethearchaeia archaeon]
MLALRRATRMQPCHARQNGRRRGRGRGRPRDWQQTTGSEPWATNFKGIKRWFDRRGVHGPSINLFLDSTPRRQRRASLRLQRRTRLADKPWCPSFSALQDVAHVKSIFLHV